MTKEQSDHFICKECGAATFFATGEKAPAECKTCHAPRTADTVQNAKVEITMPIGLGGSFL